MIVLGAYLVLQKRISYGSLAIARGFSAAVRSCFRMRLLVPWMRKRKLLNDLKSMTFRAILIVTRRPAALFYDREFHISGTSVTVRDPAGSGEE